MPTKPNSTLIAMVLDRSGSMNVIRDATIESVNAFVAQQKELPGEAMFSLVQFDTEFLTTHYEVALSEVQPLTRETYSPRAGTALLDAIGVTIDSIGVMLASRAEEERPSKVVMVIQTDGYENASYRYTKDKIFEMITHQHDKYGWDFIFLGANQDAIRTAATFGISQNWAFTYNADNLSIGKAMYAAGQAVNSSRYGVVNNYSNSLRDSAMDSSMSLDAFKKQATEEQAGVLPVVTVTTTTKE